MLGGPRRRGAKRAPAAVHRRNPRGHQNTYDAMGSLIAVNLPDGRLIEYVTDGKGRRIGKVVNGVLAKQWIYRDQLKPVAELDGVGNIISEFIFGTKTNVPDLVIRSGATYRLVSDELSSPVLAINISNSSDIPFQATYSAFGERTLVSGTDDWMPFGFAGGIFDSDTKLIRFGARDYAPTIGRWITKDPARFGAQDRNFYDYGLTDPIQNTDSTGMDADPEMGCDPTLPCRQSLRQCAGECVYLPTTDRQSACSSCCSAAFSRCIETGMWIEPEPSCAGAH